MPYAYNRIYALRFVKTCETGRRDPSPSLSRSVSSDRQNPSSSVRKDAVRWRRWLPPPPLPLRWWRRPLRRGIDGGRYGRPLAMRYRRRGRSHYNTHAVCQSVAVRTPAAGSSCLYSGRPARCRRRRHAASV